VHYTTLELPAGRLRSLFAIMSIKPDPRQPHIVKVIAPEEVADRAGYTRPHTVHCGPEGIYIAALGNTVGEAPFAPG
jgi:selenium-binding protein 1